MDMVARGRGHFARGQKNGRSKFTDAQASEIFS